MQSTADLARECGQGRGNGEGERTWSRKYSSRCAASHCKPPSPPAPGAAQKSTIAWSGTGAIDARYVRFASRCPGSGDALPL